MEAKIERERERERESKREREPRHPLQNGLNDKKKNGNLPSR